MSDQAARVKSIFLEAIEKYAPEQWPAFVDRACADDAALRAGVEKLLHARAEIGSFHEGPNPRVGATIDEPSAERAGTVIGPYKLLEPIGEGGMGTVWMAQQTEPVKRLVAVKLIKPGMDSRQVLARFEAERQALALMDHPNIARVLDAGTTDAGRPYFVMDLVRGVPITTYCDEHHLTPRQRLELFVPVCQAVQHAHQKGIIHRDLKPSNVLVAPYDGRPVPKVIDFGIAKAAGQPLTDKTLVTGFGAIVGTLEYMSPEQAEINQLDIDTRSDIYSLGVLLYELLAGSPPFTRKESEKGGVLEMLRVIREQEPTKPSAKLSTAEGLPTLAANRGTEPAKLTRLVRGELDWIVMKTLEKDRNRRYETANGFAMDVQRYLADEAVQACPPSAGYRFRKFARRHKRGLIMAGLVAATLFVALATLAVSHLKVNDALAKQTEALTEKTQALEALDTAKRETEAVNATLTETLEREQQTAYRHRIALAHREWLANNPDRALELLNECPEKYRHWEWHFLYRLHHTDLLTLRNQHGGFAEDVAYSPDGRLLASVGGNDLVARVWEVRTGRLVRTLQGHKRQIHRVVFSPDGSRLATAGFDDSLRVWDAATGQQLVSIARPMDWPPIGLAFSPDGSRIACTEGGRDGTAAKIWDATTGQELFSWTEPDPPNGRPPSSLVGVALSPDGKYLVPFSFVSLWLVELETKKTVKLNNPAIPFITRVVFSRDGRRLAAAGPQGRVTIWEVPSGNPLLNLRFSSATVHGLAFSPDGRHLGAACGDHSIHLLNSVNGVTITTLRGHAAAVNSAVFSPDGRQIASAGADGMIRIWDITAPQAGSRFVFPKGGLGMGSVAFSGDGQRLTAVKNEDLWTWDLTTNRQLSQRQFAVAISNMPPALSPDGRYLAGTRMQKTFLLEVASGREVFAHQQRTNSLAFSPDGRLLAEGLMDGSVRVTDVGTGRVLQSLQGHSVGNARVAFSTDGKRLASAGHVPNVKVWEVGTWQELHTLNGHTAVVLCLSFSHDNRYLATGSGDKSICIWDAATGQKLFSLPGQVDAVSCVCFSMDGKRLFSCGQEGSVNIWDLQNRVILLTVHGADKSVALSPDGKRLATSGESEVVQVWETELLGREERWKRHLERIPFWQPQETGKAESETGSRP
jgi:eukaryotic-like serine/threonine-protein kinase